MIFISISMAYTSMTCTINIWSFQLDFQWWMFFKWLQWILCELAFYIQTYNAMLSCKSPVKSSSAAKNMLSDHVKLSGLLCSGCCPEYGGVAKLLNTYESFCSESWIYSAEKFICTYVDWINKADLFHFLLTVCCSLKVTELYLLLLCSRQIM